MQPAGEHGRTARIRANHSGNDVLTMDKRHLRGATGGGVAAALASALLSAGAAYAADAHTLPCDYSLTTGKYSCDGADRARAAHDVIGACSTARTSVGTR